MSVIDLRTRMTNDWNQFHTLLSSSDSLVFVDCELPPAEECAGSIDLSVGGEWYDRQAGAYYSIPDEGFSIPPDSAIVITTAETIALPLNVFGLVTGKGAYIFRAAFVSPGKIDPGFHGKLKIGFHNAGREKVVLKRGAPFCSCCFFSMESGADVPLKSYDIQPPAQSPKPTRGEVFTRFLRENWDKVIPIGISILAFGAAVVSIVVSASK